MGNQGQAHLGQASIYDNLPWPSFAEAVDPRSGRTLSRAALTLLAWPPEIPRCRVLPQAQSPRIQLAGRYRRFL